ncbi:hypothetical protein VST7929_03185 [Vibrio stylophorae]|uniref:AB hydrolase-1 domain-containing protein n=1 Tax=Vibrio stylophorae TaxID=659351 RepID=A0ABM8ZY12_9VIBR|nr:alpha/beta fold hydrolase [Vibrio stylophorae]CAH0535700.1 hypothetical protein VST7929_03185 [Vibrio stylophorae]
MSRQIKVTEGRTIEIEQYGEMDAYPVVFFHDLLGGVQICPDLEAAAVQYGFKIIAIARPGYGSSTPAEYKYISDWNADMMALVKALSLENYAVLAHGTGAPFALSCSQMMTHGPARTVVLNGIPALYLNEVRQHYGMVRRQGMNALRTGFSAVKKALLPKMVQQFIETHHQRTTYYDSFLASDPQRILPELELQQSYWGVDLLSLKAVKWYHGQNATWSPLSAAEEMISVSRGVMLSRICDLAEEPTISHWEQCLGELCDGLKAVGLWIEKEVPPTPTEQEATPATEEESSSGKRSAVNDDVLTEDITDIINRLA